MNKDKIELCRKLRKNQTDAERKLWGCLRNRNLNGIKFRRQFAIGKYILDFYAPEYKLAVEADGGQHYSEPEKTKDKNRSASLSKLGINVIRFADTDILKNTSAVCEEILKILNSSPLSSPQKGEEGVMKTASQPSPSQAEEESL